MNIGTPHCRINSFRSGSAFVRVTKRMDLRCASASCLKIAVLRAPGLKPTGSAMLGPSSNVNTRLWPYADPAKSTLAAASNVTMPKCGRRGGLDERSIQLSRVIGRDRQSEPNIRLGTHHDERVGVGIGLRNISDPQTTIHRAKLGIP